MVKREPKGEMINNIIKDYAINWILYTVWKSGYWSGFILKGGTCLRKAYFGEYRVSIDIDYNLMGMDGHKELLETVFIDELEKTNKISPVKFRAESVRIKEEYGSRLHKGKLVGYQIRIPFHPYLPERPIPWRGTEPVIKVDLTLDRYERTLLKPKIKPLIVEDTMWPQLYSVRIQAYSLEEIYAEKTRALVQRIRVRDLYDLWFLNKSRAVNLEIVAKILPHKFAIKELDLSEIDIIHSLLYHKEEFERSWKRYLPQFVPNVPPFEPVWNSVIRAIEEVNIRHDTQIEL